MKNKTFKGTPWPWIKGDGAVYAKGGSDIAAVFDGVSDDVLKMDMEVVKANVNLIAAAPELLEAAQLALKKWGNLSQLVETYEALEAVIDKALGNE